RADRGDLRRHGAARRGRGGNRLGVVAAGEAYVLRPRPLLPRRAAQAPVTVVESASTALSRGYGHVNGTFIPPGRVALSATGRCGRYDHGKDGGSLRSQTTVPP